MNWRTDLGLDDHSGTVDLEGRGLTLEQVGRVAKEGAIVRLAPGARDRMERSRAIVEAAIGRRDVVYGVSTGFGRLSDQVIPTEEIRALQINLLRSHAVGVGEAVSEEVARAIMLLRAHTLASGQCGVRPVLCEKLIEMLNSRVWPRIPSQGSVGASGDLAPLAHLGLVLVGEGEATRSQSEVSAPPVWEPSPDVLRGQGIEPIVLEAKEGLSLVNGTQFMTAIGALTLQRSMRLVEAAEIAGALSLEATLGTRVALRREIQEARPHPGQLTSGARLRTLLGDASDISRSHAKCGRVQDAYSFRCMPQVHGAVRDALEYVRGVIGIEINAITDNPIVFLAQNGDHEILSGGNFHGAPVAGALDFMAIAVTDLAAISERRIEALVDPVMSGLPAFLTENAGLRSGFMMHQVTAAALVSECKGLSHPASVDTIPTSANKEDHVSMGAWSAIKAGRIVENAERVVAIELLAAAQGIDLRRPLTSSEPLEEVHARIRSEIPRLIEDRPGDADIEALAELIRAGELLRVGGAFAGLASRVPE